MKHDLWVGLAVVGALARSALAQSPSPGTLPPGEPSAEPGAGSATSADREPTFEPEHVVSTKPVDTATVPATTATVPATTATVPVTPDGALTLDGMVLTSTNRIDLNFFGDVSLEQRKAQKAAVAVGPLGFQVTAHLADRLVGRTEFAMIYENGETVVDIERAYLEFRTARWAFAAGRTHAELGYWNNAFHHGRWLQLTINRPHVLRFEDEGGFLQVHSVGVSASYAPPRGDHGLEVAVGAGNGHGRTIDQVQTQADNNWAKSILLRVGAVGIGHPALRFGFNIAVDKIAREDVTLRPLLPGKAIFELVTGVYLALRGEHLMVFSETYNVLHRGGNRYWQITDGFLVAGYRFGQFIPYGELEARRGDGPRDPFYNPDPATGSEAVAPGDLFEAIAGLRYEVNAWSALKLELSAGTYERVSDYRAELNWSFGR